MADANEPQVQSKEDKLMYLDFVHHAADYATKAYDYAKDKTGPLKSGVEKIETTLKTVAGPTYDKFRDYNVVALKFVDNKVDRVLPPVVKDATITAKSLSSNVASDLKNVGVVGTAKQLLGKIDPVAEEYTASAWKTLNYIPFVTKVAEAVTPTATLVTEKYNKTLQKTAEGGYQLVSSYLPFVPTEKLARVFAIPEAAAAGPTGGEREVPGGGGEEAAEAPAGGEEGVAEA